MNLFLVPLWMVSGAVFPISEAHTWIRWIMLVNPLTYSVAAVTRLLPARVAPGTPELLTGLAVTAAFGVALLAASTVLVNRKTSVSYA